MVKHMSIIKEINGTDLEASPLVPSMTVCWMHHHSL